MGFLALEIEKKMSPKARYGQNGGWESSTAFFCFKYIINHGDQFLVFADISLVFEGHCLCKHGIYRLIHAMANWIAGHWFAKKITYIIVLTLNVRFAF